MQITDFFKVSKLLTKVLFFFVIISFILIGNGGEELGTNVTVIIFNSKFISVVVAIVFKNSEEFLLLRFIKVLKGNRFR